MLGYTRRWPFGNALHDFGVEQDQPRNKRKEYRMDVVRIIAAILVPPLGVFLQVGFGGHFWLNILLTLLGYVPGIIHAIWIIARK